MANERIPLEVHRDLNKIEIKGGISPFSVARVLATVHNCTEVREFADLELDFSGCRFAAPAAMLPICTQVMAYREAGVEIRVQLPTDEKENRLFRNTNWAYYLDPRQYDLGTSRSYLRLPATQYKSTTEQHRIVDDVVKTVLASIESFDRSEIGAFEWAINEITDNVLVHAQSSIGGLVQVISFPRKKYVQFIVADAGLGIPGTLRGTIPGIDTDVELLDRAIREGVTRDKSLGQGNGLFGTFSICEKGEGTFRVVSGNASLGFNRKKQLRIQNEQIPYAGTVVSASLDFSTPGLLAGALKISGSTRRPVDFVESHYESEDSEDLMFKVSDEAASFGSRVAGMPVRKRLLNLLNLSEGNKVIIDFKDIALVSSSFADEVVGKLYAELGPISFGKRVEIRNTSPIVKGLIEKAMIQRSTTGL